MTSRSQRRVGYQRSSGVVGLEQALSRLAHAGAPDWHVSPDLDDTTSALVQLAALIALGGSAASYRSTIEAAATAGATSDEVVGTLIAIAPTVGLARLIAATPALALALGYDIEAIFEDPDTPPRFVDER